MNASNLSNPTVASATALQVNKEKEQKLESKGTLVEKEQFQEYKAARSSVRLITHGGIKVTFTDFRLLTQSPAVMDYLNSEIKAGTLPGITKGELLTLDEVNPMATLKRKVRAELLEEMKKEASDKAEGITRDMGESAMQKLNPANSGHVAKA